MFIDGQRYDGGIIEGDVCIIGTGAAGLTLATELEKSGLSVVLVESGARQFEWRSHRLLETELTGKGTNFLLTGTRERFLGGTTNHWGGVCRTFDAFEFTRHAWVPHSGWPLERADLEPYYEKAANTLGLPELYRHFDARSLGVVDRQPLVDTASTDMQQVIWRRVPMERRNFGRWLEGHIAASDNIRCILNTTIVEIHPDGSGSQVVSVEGRTYNGRTLSFRARDFVLCTGTIENARLLLASDSRIPGGIGNEYGLVGRYYMDHPGHTLGYYMPNDPEATRSQEEFLSDTELVGWATANEARKERHLFGFQAFFAAVDLPELLQHEKAIRALTHSPFDPASDSAPARRRIVLANWEQSPNPNSRILLSEKRDALGARRAALHWDYTEADLASARQNVELFSLALARSGAGRLHANDITAKPLQSHGGHQMGTTRMSHDPKDGVTDPQGRVHSMENLFVGGSSLFPTGGWQHPTLTIVALALRQADHIAARLKAA